MKLTYINTPKFRVSDITVETENDDIIVLSYIVKKLVYVNHKYTHYVSVNSSIGDFNAETYPRYRVEEGALNNEKFCDRICTLLQQYTNGQTSIALTIFSHVWGECYNGELSDNLTMSEEVTKLYAEYLMVFK